MNPAIDVASVQDTIGNYSGELYICERATDCRCKGGCNCDSYRYVRLSRGRIDVLSNAIVSGEFCPSQPLHLGRKMTWRIFVYTEDGEYFRLLDVNPDTVVLSGPTYPCRRSFKDGVVKFRFTHDP